jgi:hygromycin-B 7''-O-kinase
MLVSAGLRRFTFIDIGTMDERKHLALLASDPDEFARHLLHSLALPATPLLRSHGWSNQVWLAPDHVVRLSSGRFRDAFAHETQVLRLLSPAVPHARVIAYGRAGQREWLIQARVPGQPLAAVWSDLSNEQRRQTVSQLSMILCALHHSPLPPDFHLPWLDDALAPGGHPENAYHAPPDYYRQLLAAAKRIPGVDPALLNAVDTFIAERLPAFVDDQAVLVHSDLHFANLLWHDGLITAVLDFEGARPAAPDQELDMLLRFVREPQVVRGPGEQSGPAHQELWTVPDWLAEAYPALFAHPRLTDRLAVYDALWQLVQLHHFPPESGPPDPYGHLKALLTGVRPWH